MSSYFFLEKRIDAYIRDRLRAPPLHDIVKWAKKLNVPKSEAMLISDQIQLRHQLGNVGPPSKNI